MDPDLPAFGDLVSSADQRMQALYQRAGSPPTHQHGLISETFEELQLSLEELHVAMEELRQQNDVLIEAQSKLASERVRYTELFDSAPDPYIITDVNGLILEANTAAAELVNVTRRYIIGKPLASYISPVDKEQFRVYVATVAAQRSVQHWPMTIKPRHLENAVPVLVSASAMRRGDGEIAGLRWTMRDASVPHKIEQAQAARAVAERERAELAGLFDDIGDPLFVISHFWTVTIANKRCLEVWRLRPEEAIGSTLWELFPGLADSDAGRRLRTAAHQRESGHFQVDAFADLGGWVEMHVHPVANGLAVYFRDITARREQEQLAELAHTRDHTIAETLQRSLLVKPHQEDLPGVEIGMVYQAAWKDALVGGDYYDAFRIGDEPKIALVVGDVTGKGLKAAAHTAQLKYVLRAFLWETQSPGAALAKLNDFICSQHFDGRGGEDASARLVAVSVALVDPRTGDVTFASAGGSPIMMVGGEGQSRECEVDGMLIGVMPGQQYDETRCTLGPGDRLLMTTDGIVDARSPDGAFLGLDGLRAMLSTASGDDSPQQSAAQLLEKVRSFSGSHLQDDVCLLIARLQ